MGIESVTNQPPVVALRDVLDADLPILFEHQSEPEAARMAAVHPRDPDNFAAHWAHVRSDPSIYIKAVTADDQLAGYITSFRTDDKDWVGYWIAQSHWGRGIATKALALMLSDLRTRPLHARVACTNLRSIRVLERCGFGITGYRDAPADDRFPACREALLSLD